MEESRLFCFAETVVSISLDTHSFPRKGRTSYLPESDPKKGQKDWDSESSIKTSLAETKKPSLTSILLHKEII